MDALKTNQEVVHEGWLIKSPPTKLWKARWRQRWFTLRHSGELPGQYFLEYYTDRRCRKLKGTIDLDQCEQVDAGLSFENKKDKYQNMFNVKTPKRIYYLVANDEADMNKWVDAICQVCGLKAYTQDEDQSCQMFPFESQDSPPISPTSTLSNPYIPISECISGPRLNDTSSLSSVTAQNIDNYDVAKRIVPSPPRSPTTDAESTVTDDECVPALPNVNWDTFPSAGDLKPNFKSNYGVKKRFGKLKKENSDKPPVADEVIPIPPRPPKPSHMVTESPGHNYLNLDGATESSKPTTPSTPASLTISNDLNNTGVSKSYQVVVVKTESNTLNKLKKQHNSKVHANVDDHVFRYDFDNGNYANTDVLSATTYSNLSSPSKKDSANTVPIIIVPPPPPPVVHRELKPGRKTSDSNTSHELSPIVVNKDAYSPDQIHHEPPSINRKLKPALAKSSDADVLHLALPPGKGKVKPVTSPILTSKLQRGRHPSMSDDDNVFEEREEIYFYQDNENFIPASNRNLLVLQYLDLDLEKSESLNNSTLQPSSSPLATTVYKTVDFVKTEAFNRTRQRVEEERKQCTDDLT